jgi:hypothetical protein
VAENNTPYIKISLIQKLCMKNRKNLQIVCMLVISLTGPVNIFAEEMSASKQKTNNIWLGPPSEFYPQYIADPRRAQFALVFTNHTVKEVPGTTNARSSIRFGGRIGLVRHHPADNTEIGLQADLEGGFFSQFSLEGGWDNYAWDGVLGLLVSYKPAPQLGFRFGILHDSAHLGDEYM